MTDTDRSCICICMRTTLNIDDRLLAEASRYTGIREKTRLLHLGLEALVEREAARRLAAMGGTDPTAKAGRRRRGSPRS